MADDDEDEDYSPAAAAAPDDDWAPYQPPASQPPYQPPAAQRAQAPPDDWEPYRGSQRAGAPPEDDWEPYKPESEVESPWVTGVRHFVHGLPAMAAGAATGALYGSLGGPGGTVGGIIAGGLGAFGESYLQSKATEKFAPEEAERLRAGAEANPTAAILGNVATAGPFIRPNLGTLALGQRAVSGTLTGVTDVAQQLAFNNDVDLKEAALTAAGGAVFAGRPTRLGRAIGLPDHPPAPGEQPPPKPPPEPPPEPVWPAQGEMPWSAQRQPELPMPPSPPWGPYGSREGVTKTPSELAPDLNLQERMQFGGTEPAGQTRTLAERGAPPPELTNVAGQYGYVTPTETFDVAGQYGLDLGFHGKAGPEAAGGVATPQPPVPGPDGRTPQNYGKATGAKWAAGVNVGGDPALAAALRADAESRAPAPAARPSPAAGEVPPAATPPPTTAAGGAPRAPAPAPVPAAPPSPVAAGRPRTPPPVRPQPSQPAAAAPAEAVRGPNWLEANRQNTIAAFANTPKGRRVVELARAGKVAKEIAAETGLTMDEVRVLRDHAGVAPAGPLMTPGGATIPREAPTAPAAKPPKAAAEPLSIRSIADAIARIADKQGGIGIVHISDLQRALGVPLKDLHAVIARQAHDGNLTLATSSQTAAKLGQERAAAALHIAGEAPFHTVGLTPRGRIAAAIVGPAVPLKAAAAIATSKAAEPLKPPKRGVPGKEGPEGFHKVEVNRRPSGKWALWINGRNEGHDYPTRADAEAAAKNLVKQYDTAIAAAPEPPKAAPPKAAAPSIEQRIRNVVRDLVGEPPQDAVRLNDLRAKLPDVPRDQLDAALVAMRRNKTANLMPLDNPRDIKRVGDAALRDGRNTYHTLVLEPAAAAPKAAAAIATSKAAKPTKAMPTGDQSTAYKGYAIKHNTLNDTFHVSKDGHHISSTNDLAAAKRSIDAVVGEPPKAAAAAPKAAEPAARTLGPFKIVEVQGTGKWMLTRGAKTVSQHDDRAKAYGAMNAASEAEGISVKPPADILSSRSELEVAPPTRGGVRDVDAQPMRATSRATLRETLNRYGSNEGLDPAHTSSLRNKVHENAGDTPVYIVPHSELEKIGLRQNRGYYDLTHDHIVLSEDLLKNHVEMSQVALHEGLHAATAHAINANPHLEAAATELMHDLLKSERYNVITKSQHGFTNPHEFLAEAFTTQRFQKLLRGHDLSPEAARTWSEYLGARVKTAWDAVVNFVRKALGIPKAMTNALDAALRTTEAAMELNPAAKAARGGEGKILQAAAREPPKAEAPAAQNVLAKYYRQLPTKTLLDMQQRKLPDANRAALEAEIARRPVQPETSAAPEQPAPSPEAAAPAEPPKPPPKEPPPAGKPPKESPIPAAEATPEDMRKGRWVELQRLLGVTASSTPSGRAGRDIALRAKGVAEQQEQVAKHLFTNKMHKDINTLPGEVIKRKGDTEAQNYGLRPLINYIQGGDHFPGYKPPDRILPVIDALRKVYANYRNNITAIPEFEQQQFWNDKTYLTGHFKNPDEAAGFFSSWAGGPTTAGGRGSLKAKKFPTDEDAIDAGHTPVTSNPIERVLMYVNSMAKFLAWRQTLGEGKATGYIKAFAPEAIGGAGTPEPGYRKRPPPGWARIDNAFDAGGRALWAPKEFAVAINNLHSAGITHSVYQGIRRVGNAFTAVELLGPLYHGVTTVHETVARGMGTAVSQVAAGRLDLAAQSFARGLWRPISGVKQGTRLRDIYLRLHDKAALDAINATPQERAIVGAMRDSNWKPFGIQHTLDYDMSRAGSALTAYLRGELSIAKIKENYSRIYKDRDIKEGMLYPLRLAGQTMQAISQPLFEFYIPRMKASAAFDNISAWLHLNPDATPAQLHETTMRTLKDVDNFMGEMTHENTMMNKVVRDGMAVVLRSPSFTIGGTFRGIIGGWQSGIRGALKGQNRASMKSEYYDPRFASAIAYFLSTGMLGAAYTFLKTGKVDKDDIWPAFLGTPHTGGQQPGVGGKKMVPEEALLPGYHKDLRAYLRPFTTDAGELNHIWEELKNKAPVLLTALIEQNSNKRMTAYGPEPIVPPDAKLPENLSARARAALEKLIPIVAKQAGQTSKKGTNITYPEQVFGFRPPGTWQTDPEGDARSAYARHVREWQAAERAANRDRKARGLPPLPPRPMPKQLPVQKPPQAYQEGGEVEPQAAYSADTFEGEGGAAFGVYPDPRTAPPMPVENQEAWAPNAPLAENFEDRRGEPRYDFSQAQENVYDFMHPEEVPHIQGRYESQRNLGPAATGLAAQAGYNDIGYRGFTGYARGGAVG